MPAISRPALVSQNSRAARRLAALLASRACSRSTARTASTSTRRLADARLADQQQVGPLLGAACARPRATRASRSQAGRTACARPRSPSGSATCGQVPGSSSSSRARRGRGRTPDDHLFEPHDRRRQEAGQLARRQPLERLLRRSGVTRPLERVGLVIVEADTEQRQGGDEQAAGQPAGDAVDRQRDSSQA